MPNYGYTALAPAVGMAQGLEQVLKQRLLERQMAAEEQRIRQTDENADLQRQWQQQNAEAMAQDRRSAAEAAAKRDDTARRFEASKLYAQTAPVGASLRPEFADLPPVRHELNVAGMTTGDVPGIGPISVPKIRAYGASAQKPPSAPAGRFVTRPDAQGKPENAWVPGTQASPVYQAPRAEPASAVSDTEVSDAARNIVANPRDPVSIRQITSLRGEQRIKLFNEIKRIKPDFNVGMVDRQIKFLDSYEDPKGRAALNRGAMNNILMHTADLADANDAYWRSDVRLFNTPINKLASQNSVAWQSFQTPLNVLREEIALYFAGGYAPQMEQSKAWRNIVSDSATPAQIEQFAKDVIHVGLRRADTHNQQFRTMMGYDDPNLITPEAASAAGRIGVGDAVRKYGSGGQLGTRPGAEKPSVNAGSVPPAVSSALSSATPGRHTLSDGSVWDKKADGTITKVR